MLTKKKSFKLVRAGGPSLELILPATQTGTLSQQQAETIVKAAAERLARQAVRNEGTSDQYRDEQMIVERLGVARETLSPRKSYAQQLGTLASQVDQFCTVREVINTRSHELDSELEAVSPPEDFSSKITTTAKTRVLAGPDGSAVGFDAEGKRAPHTAVMTVTLLTNDFEVLVRSPETVVEEKNWEQGQLTEVLVVEHQHQRLMEERWNPATSAVKDVDDAMIDELLKAIEELDESHELSEEVEAIIDALLEELDLENADQGRGGRSELLELEGVFVHGVHKMLTESVCVVTKATGRSETDIEAEGKCFFPNTEAKGSIERHCCHTLDEAIPQRPALTQRRRFWVPHRKHCRRRTENQQMGLQRLCWPTHRKHGRWKVDQKMGQSPRLQLRSDGARRRCSRRKRVKWKSGNRGDTMLRCM